MSRANVKSFLEKLLEDAPLREKMHRVASATGKPMDAKVADAVQLAAGAGFSFSADDYLQEVMAWTESQHAAGPGPDESAEVEGQGTLYYPCTGTSCLITCADPNEPR